MFCCCKKTNKVDPRGPIVTIFGASGYVGKCVMPPFLTALNAGRIQELRVPCRDPSNETIQGFVDKGAKASKVDFKDVGTLVEALSGTHTVVSCLGALGNHEGTLEMNEALVEAMVDAGVKSFFPSEFDSNHYQLKPEYNHPVFNAKKAVYKSAKEKGLRPIRIFCGDLAEGTFGKWFGFDSNTEVWSIVERANVPVAMTSEKDVGHFTLEAVLLAYSQPNKMVDQLEVYSYQKTLAEYAAGFDKVAGRPLKLEFIPLAEAKKEYKGSRDFLMLLRILFCEGTYDYTNSSANELLNPGGKRWTLQTFEDYAEATGGRPFKSD